LRVTSPIRIAPVAGRATRVARFGGGTRRDRDIEARAYVIAIPMSDLQAGDGYGPGARV
jgi:hypothetical protein